MREQNFRDRKTGRNGTGDQRINILVIYAHPNPKSFNHALLTAIVEEAAAKCHECAVRDLYALSFQPSLTNDDFESFNHGRIPDDIKVEQEGVRRADVVVFLHPIWWFGLPAIFKGWIDRIFSYGFAYGHDSRGVKPLLDGKKCIIVNTTGAPEEAGYNETGNMNAMVTLTEDGIYKFVGLDIILHRIFFEVPSATDEERRDMLEVLRSDLRKLL